MGGAFWLCRTAEGNSTAQSNDSCIPVVKGQIPSGIAALEFLRGLLVPVIQRISRCQSIFRNTSRVVLSSSLLSLDLLLEHNSEILQISEDLIDSDQAA